MLQTREKRLEILEFVLETVLFFLRNHFSPLFR